jgi:hypothetical protein
VNKEETAGRYKMKFEVSQLADIIERGLEVLGESSSILSHPLSTAVTFGAPWVYGGTKAQLYHGDIKVFQIERKEEQTLDSDIRVLRLGIVEKEQELK